MAISWGPYESSIPLRVGIDLTVSGTTATIKYYVGTGSTGAYQDNQVMTYTGSYTGSTSFFNSTGNSDTQLVATKTKTVSPGTKYTFSASISGAFNGATPSHSVSTTVPVSKPTAPTGLNETNITNVGATLNWTQPSNWGGNDTDDYELQYSTTTSFTGPIISVANATSKAISGLSASTKYYWKVRGTNSAGDGAFSSTGDFTTLPNPIAAPGPPGTPTHSSITVSGAKSSWTAPTSTGGSTITGYDIQRSETAGFSSPTTITVTGLSYTWSGLEPNTTYYTRVRAKNAAGTGAWSGTSNFKTLAGAKVRINGAFKDVPTAVRVGGAWVGIAPQKRVNGAWKF